MGIHCSMPLWHGAMYPRCSSRLFLGMIYRLSSLTVKPFSCSSRLFLGMIYHEFILRLDNGTEFVCTNFRQSRKKPLKVYCYIPTEKKWAITFLKGNYKEIMWDYYRKCESKSRIRKGNYEQMMKHTRKHKSGGGGSRIYNGRIHCMILEEFIIGNHKNM